MLITVDKILIDVFDLRKTAEDFFAISREREIRVRIYDTYTLKRFAKREILGTIGSS